MRASLLIALFALLSVASAVRWNFGRANDQDVQRRCGMRWGPLNHTVTLACARFDNATNANGDTVRRRDVLVHRFSTVWVPRFATIYIRQAQATNDVDAVAGGAFNSATRTLFLRVIVYNDTARNVPGFNPRQDERLWQAPLYGRPWSPLRVIPGRDGQINVCSRTRYGDNSNPNSPGWLEVRLCQQVGQRPDQADPIDDEDDPDANVTRITANMPDPTGQPAPRVHPNANKWTISVATERPLPRGIHIALRVARQVREAATAFRRYADADSDVNGTRPPPSNVLVNGTRPQPAEDQEDAELLDQDDDNRAWAVATWRQRAVALLIEDTNNTVVAAGNASVFYTGVMTALTDSIHALELDGDNMLGVEPSFAEGGDGNVIRTTLTVRRIGYFAFYAHGGPFNTFIWDPEIGFVTSDAAEATTPGSPNAGTPASPNAGTPNAPNTPGSSGSSPNAATGSSPTAATSGAAELVASLMVVVVAAVFTVFA